MFQEKFWPNIHQQKWRNKSMIFWDVMLCGLADANTTPYLYQFFPCTLLLYLEDKKEAADSPETLVPICQTAPYQMNRIILLILVAMATSNLIFRKLPRQKKILWGVMICSLIENQNFIVMYCFYLQQQVPPKCHSKFLPEYMAPHPKTHSSSQTLLYDLHFQLTKRLPI
jgi:hypothetical protein